MDINNNIPLYVKIDREVKERATLYVTKSKLLDLETKTMNKLIEKAVIDYMIEHPL